MATEQSIVIVGSDGTEHEFPAGMDPQKAAAIVRQHEADVAPKPVSQHEAGMGHDPIANLINRVSPGTGDYLEGAAQGLREGVVGGAKGFAKGIIPGMANGALEVVKSPYTLGKGVLDAGIGAYHLATDFDKTAHESIDAMSAMPGKVRDSVSAAMDKAAKDPDGFGNDVGHLTGTAVSGVAAGRAVPLLPKPIARSVGNVVEGFGKKVAWPMQISGAHQLLQGNPAGVIPMVLPQVLEKSGRKLQQLGEDPAIVKAESDAMLQRGAPKPQASIRVSPPPKDYYKVAQENAAEAAAAKGGGPAAGGPPAGWPANVPYDPSKLVGEIQPMRGGPKVVTLGGGPARPSIRIVGKAAADLAAEPGIVPNEGVHPAPPVIDPAAQAVRDQTARSPIADFLKSDPQARVGGEGRMTGQFREGEGGLSDLQAGRIKPAITPTGKAATDLAEGKVPTASTAPTPSDTRLDELVGKFAEGPKPARVTTQEAIPASKSKGPKSATPGLTRADLQEAGLNPDLNYKDLTPDMVEKIKANRASRHQTNYANAQSDRRFGTTRDDLKSVLEQSLLMNMDRLR